MQTRHERAPIMFGIDKFATVMPDWTKYLASQYDDLIPGTASQAMHAVGIVESGYADVALRDFGPMLGARTLGRLATAVSDGTSGAGGRGTS